MPRFFVNSEAVDKTSGVITITGEDVKHIASVLRMEPGEELTVSDGSGVIYDAVIKSIDKDRVKAEISNAGPDVTEPTVDIVLYQGIPKSDKMDLIIQKCVELGANKIVPVINARTVVRLESQKDAAAKTSRWQRISLEAAKQCNRGIIPEVAMPLAFNKAIESLEEGSRSVIPYEKERAESLRSFINDFRSSKISEAADGSSAGENPEAVVRRQINVFIGPEGGFTEEEITLAAKHGIRPVTLGPRILRTETAGLAVLSILMYELGNIG